MLQFIIQMTFREWLLMLADVLAPYPEFDIPG